MNNTQSMPAGIADTYAQVVDQIDGRPVTRGELDIAFRKVENLNNWKLPVDRIVRLEEGESIELVLRAIEFFTGSKGEYMVLNDSTYYVTAPGYYAAVGA